MAIAIMLIAGVATLLVKDFDEDGIAVPTRSPSPTDTFTTSPTPTETVEPTGGSTTQPPKTREPTTKPTRSNDPHVPDMPKSGVGGAVGGAIVLLSFALGLLLARRRILV